MSKVFSFSIKDSEERELVEAIKRKHAAQGQKFSWVVIQALKAYDKRATDVKAK